jgi:hypothetical protein
MHASRMIAFTSLGWKGQPLRFASQTACTMAARAGFARSVGAPALSSVLRSRECFSTYQRGLPSTPPLRFCFSRHFLSSMAHRAIVA